MSRRSRRSGGPADKAGPRILVLPASDRLSWWVALVPALVALAVFLPSIRFGYTIWDDPVNASENPYVRHLSLANLRAIWSAPYYQLYIPAVYTSYAIELALSGGKPWIHHLVNVVLHAFSAGLVTLVIGRTLRAPVWATLAAGFVFAIHPVQTEAVCWVTGRKDILSGAFAVFALWQYLDAVNSQSKKRFGWSYAAALAAFCLSLLSKPASVTLPIMAMAIEVLLLQGKPLVSLKRLVPWFVVAAVVTIISSQAQPITASEPAWQKPFIAGYVLCAYILKVLFPVGLSPMYGRTIASFMQAPLWWAGLPVILCAAIALRWVRSRSVLCAVIIFVAGVLPVLGLKSFRYQAYALMADRYLYLSMIGVAMAAAIALTWIHGRWPAAPGVVVVSVGLLLAAISLHQETFWKDDRSLTTRMLHFAPDNGAVENLYSVVLYTEKRYGEALDTSRRAIRTLRHPDAYANLGAIALKIAQTSQPPTRDELLGESEGAYRRAIEMRPDSPKAFSGLGEIHILRGDYDGAIPSLQEAIRLSPRDAKSRVNLGLALMQAGRSSEAVPWFQSAVAIEEDAPIYAFLADSLLSTGRRLEAEQALARGATLNPNDPEIVAVRRKLPR